jgi:Tfp pilus assembly protein PilE
MKKISIRGVTLVEALITVVIFVVVILGFVMFFSRTIPFFHRTEVRQHLMQDARRCMENIVERVRNGKSRTLAVSNSTSVPNSRIDFVLQQALPSGATAYAIYLEDKNVVAVEFPPGVASKRIWASNVTGLMFTGDSEDPAIVGITLRMDASWDNSNDPSHMSTIIIPNQVVHMVETQ